ncbi:MAG: sulfotransferase [Gemmatimonadetes bacterium]|nr:sulfotransferase [Gemmatimonadota bacterium]
MPRYRPVRYDPGALPNLIVIGAMKCGTTSLHWYLDLHPQVVMSRPKELDFFLAQGRELNARDIKWYRSRFPADAPVRGETSPSYTKCRFYQRVPERICHAIPDARLLYILRDPVERVVSHYVHEWASRVEKRTLEDALDDIEHSHFVEPSLYHKQLSAYLECYPLSQIHVTTLEQLKAHSERTMRGIFDFLNVETSFVSPRFQRVEHPSSRKRRVTAVGQFARRKLGRHRVQRLRNRVSIDGLLYEAEPVSRPTLSDHMRQRLEDRLRDDVRELRALTGLAFDGWSL